MTHELIHVTGPAGAGKSTLVRRVMSKYNNKKMVDGGVGGLPAGYELTRIVGQAPSESWSRLFVCGNYSEIGRARHGMAQFNRHADDFELALTRAIGYSDRMPVLLEGGFQRTGRLKTLAGERYVAKVHVVVLEPPDETCQIGVIGRRESGEITLTQWERHRRDVYRVVAKLEARGSRVSRIKDREEAFMMICREVGATWNIDDTPLPKQSWR